MKITIKEEHINLLKNSYISEYNCEFGGWGLDCKRPFGDSNVISSMLHILNIFNYSKEYSEEDLKNFNKVIQDEYNNRKYNENYFDDDLLSEIVQDFYYDDMNSLYNELEHIITIIFQNPGKDLLNKTFYKENSWDSIWLKE